MTDTHGPTEEVETEAHFRGLRNDIAELRSVLKRIAESASEEARDAAIAEANVLLARSAQAMDDGMARTQDATRAIEVFIHEKPVQASMIALGIGLLVGLMSRR